MKKQYSKKFTSKPYIEPTKRHGYVRKDGHFSTYTSLSLPYSLKERFSKVCYSNGFNMSQVIKGLMEDFIIEMTAEQID